MLLTGVYGAGKTSVAEEIAGLLEARDLPCALLDLDYLSWFSTARSHGEDTLRQNVSAVTGNYRRAGVRYLVVAGSVSGPGELQGLRDALGVPVRVVRLAVPLSEIERRLRGAVTTARVRDDLPVARRWIAEQSGEGLEDLTVAADRPVSEVAHEVLEWLGWR